LLSPAPFLPPSLPLHLLSSDVHIKEQKVIDQILGEQIMEHFVLLGIEEEEGEGLDRLTGH